MSVKMLWTDFTQWALRYIPKQLLKEEFNYYSDKSVEEFKLDLEQLFEKTKGWNFSVNLTGKFTSEYEFKITPKWQFAIINSYERSESYLIGKIFQDEFKKTRVTFIARPNSIVLILFFLFPMFGLLAMFDFRHNNETNEALFVGFAFIFFVPILMMVMGHFAKSRIKNRFVKKFSLKEIVNYPKYSAIANRHKKSKIY